MDYFADDSKQGFKKDLNHKNVIGCGGKLALAFASLMKKTQSSTCVAPTDVKAIISEFASSPFYVCMYECKYACMHVCMSVCMYVSMCICVYICMKIYVYMYIYVCVSMHACLCVLFLSI